MLHRTYLTLAFLCGLTSLTTAQLCVPDQTLRDAYELDVSKLALDRAEALDDYGSDSLDFPQAVADTIWEAFVAVYQSGLPEALAVYDEYCIHDYQAFSFRPYREITVSLDTFSSWYANWSAGDITTGVAEVDSVLGLYGYTLERSQFQRSNFRLTAATDVNVFTTERYLETYAAVVFAEAGFFSPGDGDRITLSRGDGGLGITFTLGFGDCPSGCTELYAWNFTVTDCNATFVGITTNTFSRPGDDRFPRPVNCNLINATTGLAALGWGVLPNPATTTVHVNAPAGEAPFTYALADAAGREVGRGVARPGQAISVAEVPLGTFFLRVRSAGGGRDVFRLARL